MAMAGFSKSEFTKLIAHELSPYDERTNDEKGKGLEKRFQGVERVAGRKIGLTFSWSA